VSTKQTALVTGGAGFVGSHLCDRLIREGLDVIALDDLSTGSRSNIAHLMGTKGFRFVLHDVTSPFEIHADWIFSLACPASPIHYQKNPIKTVTTNVVGTLHGLSLASRTGARFLLASTSEVYGDPDVHPQPETYKGSVNPIGPRACYDEGKRCAETLCFDHYREAGVDIRVARIFNTYGPRMAVNDGRVVSNFIVQALRGEDITIYGDGQQTRSFCYVDDLVDGLWRLMNGTDVGPINLGNPGEFTVRQLAELVIEQTRSKSKIVQRPLPVDDPKQRRPDIGKASKVLGFEPKVSLADGLRPTIDYFGGVIAPVCS
jgi:UDP-glucuronate decarboxylase